MPESSYLEVQTESHDGGLILRPMGDIDLSRAPSLRTHISEVQQRSPGRLIIDLTTVNYMDSSGVATLIEGLQLARKAGSKFILCGLQERVRSVFEIARLDSVFTIVNSADEALVT